MKKQKTKKHIYDSKRDERALQKEIQLEISSFNTDQTVSVSSAGD